jgi:hypothetical protein
MYLNIITGEYPRYDGDLELLGWNVGEPLPEYWVPVEYVEPLQVTATQVVEEIHPIQNAEGSWITAWSIRELNEQELKQRKIRIIKNKVSRNMLLTIEEAMLLTE